MRNTLKWLITWLVIFVATVVIAEVALDLIVSNSVSSDAEIQGLQGIQRANYSRQRANQNKARRTGKADAAKTMAQIVEEQKPHYVTINSALESQKAFFDAEKARKYSAAMKAVNELKEKIPKAKAALAALTKLLEREIAAIRAMDNDEASIYVAKATHKSWEAAVNSLKTEVLTFSELAKRRSVIFTEGSGAIATARQIMQSLKSEELEAGERRDFDAEVVSNGKAVADNLGAILKNVPQSIFGTLAALNLWKDTSRVLKTADDTQFGQGFAAKSKMSDFEKRIDSLTGDVALYLKQLKPFISTVGRRVGRDDVVGIENTAVIRFGDPKGRYIIVEDDKDYRLSIDTMTVRRNSKSKDDIIFTYCYEFSEAGAKKFMEAMAKEDPVTAGTLKGARYVYTLAELKPSAVVIIPGTTSYQNADFGEIKRVQEKSKNVEPIKIKSDQAGMVEVLKYIVPRDSKNATLHDMQPGPRNYVVRPGSWKDYTDTGGTTVPKLPHQPPQPVEDNNRGGGDGGGGGDCGNH